MATAHAIHKFMRCSRDAITVRVARWGLGKDIDPRDLFELKALDESHAQKRSLEEERAKNTALDSELKELAIAEKRGRLADIEPLMAAENDIHESIAATIKASGMPEDRIDDCLTKIRDHVKAWGEGFDP